MKARYIYTAILLLLFQISNGQMETMPLSGIVPASPNAESFAKYSNIPVNAYSGIPSISIPIYTLSSRDISIPISLSYHAGGIKVQEEASWVGLGWTLNAGGAITQSIRGNDDLLEPNGYGQNSGGTVFPTYVQNNFEGMVANGSHKPTGEDCFNCGQYNNEGYFSYCDNLLNPVSWANYPHYLLNGQWEDFSNYVSQNPGFYDWEPDIFSFNFLGISGKFMFDETGTPVMMDMQSIHIQKGDLTGVTSNTVGFTAMLDNGLQFYFGTKEETVTKGTSNVISRTFYLNHILSPMGERATFHYAQQGLVNKPWGLSETENLYSPNNILPIGKQEIFTESEYIPQHLTAIHFYNSSKYASFDLGERLDIVGEKKLDHLRIFGEEGVQLREYDFTYSYYEGDPIYGDFTNGGCSNDLISKRLKLESFVEKNGSIQNPPHIFEYNSTPLPCKTSYAQDYWGYFNGVTDNTQIIPDFRNYYFEQLTLSTLFLYEGANRDPNPDFAKAGVLEKITYPLGGSAEFIFESNEYSNFDNLPYLNNKQLINVEEITAIDVNYSNADNIYASFEVPFLMNVTFSINISCPPSNTMCGLFNPNAPELNPFTTLYENYPSNLNLIERWPHNSEQAQLSSNPFEVTLELEPGTYWIEAFYPDTMPGLMENGFDGGVSISATIPIYEEVTKKIAGGLRVQQTKLSEGASSNNDIITKYKYSYEYEGEKYSYGKLMSPPTFYRYTDRYFEQIVDPSNGAAAQSLNNGVVINVSNTSFIPEALTAQGSNLGYSKVIAIYGENGENGRTEFDYHNNENFFSVYTGQPASLPSRGDNLNGKLLEQTDFDKDEIEVKKVVNTYTSLDEQLIKGAFQEWSPSGAGCTHKVIYWYTEKAERVELTQSMETVDGLTTISDYTYNNNHRSPVSVTRYLENDPSQAISTSYKFAHDLLNETSGWEHTAIQRMIVKNMIAIPLETLSTGLKIGGGKTKYKCFPTNHDAQMPLPFESYSIKGTLNYVLDATFLSYNSNGFVKEYLVDGHDPSTQKHLFFWEGDLLDKRTYIDFTVDYNYEENSQALEEILNFDGQRTFFEYDDLQRLSNSWQYGFGQSGSTFKTKTTNTYNLGSTNSISSSIEYGDGTTTQTTNQFFDGLGRLTQTQLNGVVKQEIGYDNFGRIAQQTYLPGSFTFLEYESSPLNRQIREIYPDDSEVLTAYGSINQFYSVTITDENGNTSNTQADILGRYIRTIDALGNTTEYAYDESGNIELVLPPNYAQTQEAYEYTYDNLNRLTSKTIPGGGTQQFKYNPIDQLTLSTNPNLLAEAQWIGTEYDIYGRPFQTGFVENSSPDPDNFSIDELLTETFYDDQSLLINFPISTCNSFNDEVTKGKVVGTRVRILDTDEWIHTASCFDKYGRSTIIKSNHHLLGSDELINNLNLADLPTQIQRNHNVSFQNNTSQSSTVTENFTYDNFLRQQSHSHLLGTPGSGSPTMLSFNVYNDLDQLVVKYMGGIAGTSDYLQNIKYQYNSRGWLTHINNVEDNADDLPIPSCNEEPPTCPEPCDYEVTFTFQGDDGLYDLQYGIIDPVTGTYSSVSAQLNPNNYFYNPYQMALFQSDLEAWLANEGIVHQGVTLTSNGFTHTLLISQTETPFHSVSIYTAGEILFSQTNCGGETPPDDICDICIRRGYDCDRCPLTELPDNCTACDELEYPNCDNCQPAPDRCTECANLGYMDCEKCPLTVKRIHPLSVKVEYSHSTLDGFSTPADNAIVIRVTESSHYVLHDLQVKAVENIRNTTVGSGSLASSSPTHIMEIDMTGNWVNQTTLNTVISNLKSEVAAELSAAGITNPDLQQAFAEAVSAVASDDWGNTTDLNPAPSGIQNPDLFAMQLVYGDEHEMVNSPEQWNGNIAGMIWKTPGRVAQSYSFNYDPINRLTNGFHQEKLGAGEFSIDDKYGVSLTYDNVGNIQTLTRNGVIGTCPPAFDFGAMDDLTYTYSGNQLTVIREAANQDHGYKGEGGNYGYDGNGNMTADGNKELDIEYNHLNLPKLITFGDGNTIAFTYDAAGIKLKKVVDGSATGGDSYTLHYVGGIEYREENNTLETEAIYHAEGRVTFAEDEKGNPVENYEYNLTDHLGNVRVVFSDLNQNGYLEPFAFDPSGKEIEEGYSEILQENHYYPFGMQMEGSWQDIFNAPENLYTYNGYEEVNDFDLRWIDYGWRSLDPAIGRWNAIDPHAENYLNWSPYHYAGNSPIVMGDIDGLDWYRDGNGNTAWFDSSNKTYTEGDTEYNRIGSMYVHYNEENGNYVVHNQNDVVAVTKSGTKGIANEGFEHGELLHSGDFWFSKKELFSWARSDSRAEEKLLNLGSKELADQYKYSNFQTFRHEAGESTSKVLALVVAPIVVLEAAAVYSALPMNAPMSQYAAWIGTEGEAAAVRAGYRTMRDTRFAKMIPEIGLEKASALFANSIPRGVRVTVYISQKALRAGKGEIFRGVEKPIFGLRNNPTKVMKVP